jgi:hypothetical protein
LADELFSREEVLSGGLSRVRRARALVYLIEQEAARAQAKQSVIAAAAPLEAGLTLTAILAGDEETMRRPLPGESDEAFIESFRNARRNAPPAQTRVICSTTGSWKVLVPEDLALRAELLHQMSLRHELPVNRAKHLAKAFGVGTPAFDEAYSTTVGSEVATVFAPATGLFARFRSKKS